jgi:hypothetical protein
MNNQNKENRPTVDRLLVDHLKAKQNEAGLSRQFNSELMNKLHQLDDKPEFVINYHGISFLLPAALIILIALGFFFYFMGGKVLEISNTPNLSIETDLFQHKGIKYMLYSLTALLGFSLIDRFVQLKIRHSSK